jgi:N-acetyl sugar amidotransferase
MLIKYCTSCLNTSLRPRISFDSKDVCNACTWSKVKKNIDWNYKKKILKKLIKKQKNFDCIVPVSGGKDSSYVAYQVKNILGLNPLCITIRPGLEYDLGKENLLNFLSRGYNHILVTPDVNVMKHYDKIGFIKYGRPLLGWQIAVQASIFKLAVQFRIPLVFFGEEGETEYGGSTKLINKFFYNVNDSIKLYLSGSNPRKLSNYFSSKQLYWFTFPSIKETKMINLKVTHWSSFENWDSYKHYLFSKKELGLKDSNNRLIGTYNNFAQTDTYLYDLHVYLMYLKFGFGRCTQDVGIDIRRGALNRNQAVDLVKKYDGEKPEIYFEKYYDYFKMNKNQFFTILKKFANKKIFKIKNKDFIPKFFIK